MLSLNLHNRYIYLQKNKNISKSVFYRHSILTYVFANLMLHKHSRITNCLIVFGILNNNYVQRINGKVTSMLIDNDKHSRFSYSVNARFGTEINKY